MEKIQKIIEKIEPIDRQMMEKTQKRLDFLTKPRGSLGRLEELAKIVVGIKREDSPNLKNKVIFTLAADHGIAREGVSVFPQEVTSQMVYNFLRGGAGINVLARHIGARVVVVDMGVASDLNPHPSLIIRKINYGTKNILKEPAMSREEAIRSINEGIEIVEEELDKGIDIIGTGDMGIGNTTASSAILAVITGTSAEEVTGRGTGIDNCKLKRKKDVISEALKTNKPDPDDPIDILSKVGGFEIGGLLGIILAGASHRIPVVIDGFISGAAALLATGLEPKVRDYLIPSHCSAEAGHKRMLSFLGLRPLFDLDLRLGEGTGAALGINMVDASVKILTQMATFHDAGVSEGQ
ncbi:MAG: nicotinate-nucleotide--dimethylbenzimidazole phosphoribosyltransferase [Elusimicrobiota bacterium]|nr:nicotinate-nucleotide--dimethylbenzimidazole phosphoribosyltransferase [Elusimicrobiota bacterium]